MNPSKMNIDSFSLRERKLRRMRLKTREDFLNVFTPASPIQNPAKFVGREKEVEDAVTALLSKGADLVVYGERGCGKSSLAYMLHSITQGDFEILDYYGLRDRLEEKGFLSWLLGPEKKRFNPIWVNGFRKPLEQVMHTILTKRRSRENEQVSGPGLLYYLPSEADQVEVASRIGFNKVFVAEDKLKEIYVREKPASIKEGFELATQRYADSHENQQLVIIIDEFETIIDRSDIAFYLKNIPNVRFILVGIAETTFDLLGQHSSIARQAHAVKLKPMNEQELRGILRVGTMILEQHCRFSKNAIWNIVSNSHRSPYWCHFLAKSLLQRQIDCQGNFESFIKGKGNNKIDVAEVREAIVTLPDNPECRLYEEQLISVLMDDEINYRVLVRIAQQENYLITSRKIAESFTEEDLDNKIVLDTVNDFLSMPNGPFEVKATVRDNSSFSFKDPNFKRYILIRCIDTVKEREEGLSKRIISRNSRIFDPDLKDL